MYPPAVHLHTNAQIKLFHDVADKDVLYFDTTGSLLRWQQLCKDYQIYTLLIRNPVEGGVSLATNVTTSHDGVSISHFLERFLIDQIKECKTAKTPALMIIDESFAMWNAVLTTMCRESRLDYHNRCFRIVRWKPTFLHLQKTIVCNCYRHSMKNACLLCNRSCASNVIREGVHWINLMFSCNTSSELDEVVDCFFILTNCMMTSDLVKAKYEKLQNWSQENFETSHQTSDMNEREEEGDHFFPN